MRYSLRTLLIAVALIPAIVWALIIGLATYQERVGVSEYKPAPERGKDGRPVKVLNRSVP